jgi:hypothetical protein
VTKLEIKSGTESQIEPEIQYEAKPRKNLKPSPNLNKE